MDGLLVVVSLAGLLMAPFWAMLWDRAFRKAAIARGARVAAVLVLSIATCLVVFLGPWALMLVVHSIPWAMLAESWFLCGMAALLSGGLALQIFCAVYASLRA